MMTNLNHTRVRMMVVTVVALAMLSTGTGCRETALLAAARGATAPTIGASAEQGAGPAAMSYVPNGPTLGGGSGGTPACTNGGATTGGCNSGVACPSSPCTGGVCPSSPVTPSWVGTSMGW